MWTLSLLFHRIPAPVNVLVAEACWMKGFQRQSTYLFQYKWNNYFLTVTCLMLVRQLQLHPVILNLFRIPRLISQFRTQNHFPRIWICPSVVSAYSSNSRYFAEPLPVSAECWNSSVQLLRSAMLYEFLWSECSVILDIVQWNSYQTEIQLWHPYW